LLSEELFNETIHYLVKEQRNDGGWGPWKNHPAQSDCFITGICMGALALSYSLNKDKIIIKSLRKGIPWVENNQLNNGLFPTHYIEEGSSWIFWGWSKTMDVLNGCSL
jgi:prenyltransferase beta subunit